VAQNRQLDRRVRPINPFLRPFEHPHRTTMPSHFIMPEKHGGRREGVSRSIKFHYFIAMGFPRACHEGEKSEILCRSRIQSSGNFYFYEFHEHPQWFACRDRANLRPACVQFSLSHRANKSVNFFPSSFFFFSHFHIFTFSREKKSIAAR